MMKIMGKLSALPGKPGRRILIAVILIPVLCAAVLFALVRLPGTTADVDEIANGFSLPSTWKRTGRSIPYTYLCPSFDIPCNGRAYRTWRGTAVLDRSQLEDFIRASGLELVRTDSRSRYDAGFLANDRYEGTIMRDGTSYFVSVAQESFGSSVDMPADTVITLEISAVRGSSHSEG